MPVNPAGPRCWRAPTCPRRPAGGGQCPRGRVARLAHPRRRRAPDRPRRFGLLRCGADHRPGPGAARRADRSCPAPPAEITRRAGRGDGAPARRPRGRHLRHGLPHDDPGGGGDLRGAPGVARAIPDPPVRIPRPVPIPIVRAAPQRFSTDRSRGCGSSPHTWGPARRWRPWSAAAASTRPWGSRHWRDW